MTIVTEARPLAQTPVKARPAGIIPVHHPDGWVGPSEGEGQEAARAWWVRSASQPPGQKRIEVLDGGWGDWILSDANPAGSMIITTPHLGGPRDGVDSHCAPASPPPRAQFLRHCCGRVPSVGAAVVSRTAQPCFETAVLPSCHIS